MIAGQQRYASLLPARPPAPAGGGADRARSSSSCTRTASTSPSSRPPPGTSSCRSWPSSRTRTPSCIADAVTRALTGDGAARDADTSRASRPAPPRSRGTAARPRAPTSTALRIPDVELPDRHHRRVRPRRRHLDLRPHLRRAGLDGGHRRRRAAQRGHPPPPGRRPQLRLRRPGRLHQLGRVARATAPAPTAGRPVVRYTTVPAERRPPCGARPGRHRLVRPPVVHAGGAGRLRLGPGTPAGRHRPRRHLRPLRRP